MNIFEENDYKKILKELVSRQSNGQRGIYRKISDYLGVNPSMVSQVISGSKDFSEEQIVAVCEFLGLPKLESRYLLTLVQITRAGSVKLRDYHMENLALIRRQALDLSKRVTRSRALSEQEQARFYSSWIYSALQLMTTLKTPPTFQDICNRFHLESKEAQEIMNFLIEIGMIIEDKGVYKPGPSQTHLSKDSPYVVNFRRNWRMKAMQAAERVSEEELMYSCNFSVSRKDFAAIREEFVKVIERFLEVAQASPAEDIAQFNIDLFWLKG